MDSRSLPAWRDFASLPIHLSAVDLESISLPLRVNALEETPSHIETNGIRSQIDPETRNTLYRNAELTAFAGANSQHFGLTVAGLRTLNRRSMDLYTSHLIDARGLPRRKKNWCTSRHYHA